MLLVISSCRTHVAATLLAIAVSACADDEDALDPMWSGFLDGYWVSGVSTNCEEEIPHNAMHYDGKTVRFPGPRMVLLMSLENVIFDEADTTITVIMTAIGSEDGLINQYSGSKVRIRYRIISQNEMLGTEFKYWHPEIGEGSFTDPRDFQEVVRCQVVSS
jgi:hypothetical protein